MNPLVALSAIVPNVDTALLAESAKSPAVRLLQRLDPAQRVSVMAGLVVIITFGGLLLLLVRTGGRLTRWYIDRPACRLAQRGDPRKGQARVVGPAVGKHPQATRGLDDQPAGSDPNTRPISSGDTRSPDRPATRRRAGR
jgi:hypothetical protein